MSLLRIPVLAVTLGASLTCAACVRERGADSPAQYSGERLFEVYCSNCHGADGTGHGKYRELLGHGEPIGRECDWGIYLLKRAPRLDDGVIG
jgi:mono/diheme cytochrome c family protein